MRIPKLIDVLGEKYPGVQAYALDSGDNYSSIVHAGGDSLPSEATLQADHLVAKRQIVWLAIQEERTRRQAGGVFIQSANKWFHSDQTSRIQQLGLVMMGANMPANINWKTMDGSFVIMTPALAVSIFNASATLDMTAFGVAEQHRANLMSSPTPETYNYLSFWPAIYGE